MTAKKSGVFLHVWTGNPDRGREFAERRYPGAEISTLVHRELRDSGMSGQLRTLRGLKGRALVVFFRSLADLKEPEIFLAVHMLHGCKETVLADESGSVRVITLRESVLSLPGLLLSMGADAMVFAGTWMFFKFMRTRGNRGMPPRKAADGSPDIAYLYPYPQNRDFEGGAMTHFLGVLEGVAENGRSCVVLSGCKFPFAIPFPLTEIPLRRKRFIFAESLALSYNWRFASKARKILAGAKPGAIYQRHGRYVITGALLARALGIPLILEYNASEIWVGENWDPARFLPWIRLAEEFMLANASVIVAVSEVLRQELLERGLPAERILVNPNGVEPSKFRNESGSRERLRRQFGFEPQHVVATFAGTFGYWHGVGAMQKAITQLLENSARTGEGSNLRFLLIGKGLLFEEVRGALREYEEQGLVVFPGLVPHEAMPAYLSVADILLSPHIPMPDGRPFFGSPTKLFEYMAMGKAIIASSLDQIQAVLEHNRTAVLVEPGNIDELARAIFALAANPELRASLGRHAREAALAEHTWKINAAKMLAAAGFEPREARSLIPG